MLLTLAVEIQIRKNTCEYYVNKGYQCNIGDTIIVSTLDLQPYSEVEIQYKCDYPMCCEIITLRYCDYYKKRQRKYASLGDFCGKHAKKAQAEYLKQHDPEGYKLSYEKRWAKARQTCLEKYGCENIMQCNEGKESLKQSMINKYGYENPMQVPEIKENFMHNLVEEHQDLEEFWNDNGSIFYKIHGIPCSVNQKHIWETIGGKLNELIKYYYVDILLDNNIYFEYDGNGHNLAVKMKRMTQEEFNLKEIQRYNILKQLSYKQIKFISLRRGALPSDKILLNLKQLACDYLSIEGNHWIEFNYDNGTIRTKQNIIQYDFNSILSLNDIV